MTERLVSIIIPCYQVDTMLQKTLDTIFGQTYRPIEVIAVNDGSTDRTNEVLESYEEKIAIINQENRGAAAARNRGFSRSHGEFVLFCDADVRLQPTMIGKMVETLRSNSNASYCYSNFKFGIHTFDLFPFDPERLRRENYISTMSLIRRRDFIGFDESLRRFQDWDLWKRMLDRGMTGIWFPERLFYSPIRWQGISGYNFRNLLRLAWHKVIGK